MKERKTMKVKGVKVLLPLPEEQKTLNSEKPDVFQGEQMQTPILLESGNGIHETSSKSIDLQSKRAAAIMAAKEFPTKLLPIVALSAKTGQNCQGGMFWVDAIDKCQHFSTCGLCVDSKRIKSSITLKPRVIGFAECYDGNGNCSEIFDQAAKQLG